MLSLAAASVCVASLGAIWVEVFVRNVPVDRLAANLERDLAADPKNVGLLVNLARVHSMAFAEKRGSLPSTGTGGPWLGNGAPAYEQFEVRGTSDPKTAATAAVHLKKAVARYREALALDPVNPVARLGLGWTLAQGDPASKAEAIDVLRDVAAKAWAAETASPPRVYHGFRTMTEEAIRYLSPLLDPVRDKDEIGTLETRARTLAKVGRWITPIAIPLADGLSARDIEQPNATVRFDADGSDLPRRWSWIRSNAAWLVFDRHATGSITSGLQLFGSVTFWLFWDNGYQALRALDDDADGMVAGKELAGLALWHDRNANGRSERGEVRPVADWSIVSLSVAYVHDPTHPDEIAWSPRGVTFRNGSTRPTFDIILHANNSITNSQ